MQNQEFIYEILVNDKDGRTNITQDQNLLKALAYPQQLWQEAFPDEKNLRIVDEKQQIELKIKQLSSFSESETEKCFMIRVIGTKFEDIESFRLALVFHLRRKLDFRSIRVLRDDISAQIASDIYPLIARVENQLRRYLILFFNQKLGTDWWFLIAPAQLTEKVNANRKISEKRFGPNLDLDLSLVELEDLGGFITNQGYSTHQLDNIISRIMVLSSMEDVYQLKHELQNNYIKYFKEAFHDKDFEKKWKKICEMKSRVSMNNLFSMDDYYQIKELVDEVSKIIADAEAEIFDPFSSDESQKDFYSSNNYSYDRNLYHSSFEHQKTEYYPERLGIKVVGKIDLPDESNNNNTLKIITEEELLRELDKAESSAIRKNLKYVGLKTFVTKILGNKGYAYGPTYSIVNHLRDKELVEIYDAEDEFSYFPSKAIRRKRI
ncbi:MAG: hypothetical protein NZ108_01580 [Bacteroidia bacterium]|nr:hypothetical protein [Bacteroidia bacterium]